MKQKILVIGTVWLAPKASAAGHRLLQLIQLFLDTNFEIHFASDTTKDDLIFDFESLNIKTTQLLLNDASFDEFIKQLNPDIVVFDRFLTEEKYGWRVAESCSNALRILDTEDLHFLRKERERCIKNGEVLTNQHLLNSQHAMREIAAILRCDLSLIISKFEFNLLKTIFKIDENLLFYLPFLEENLTENFINNLPNFEKRQDFIFIGNFLHQPNVDAILYLKNEIWKHIHKQLPQVKLLIYGAYPSEKIKSLHSEKEGFLIKGFAESSETVIKNARVLLTPLRFGAGQKGKLVEAMKYGTPSITSTIGAESMNLNGLWNGFIADKTDEFVGFAVETYQNKSTWQTSQQNGFTLFNSVFDKRFFEPKFIKRIKQLQDNLNTHRTQNFLGNMLQYHTLKATKYLSKWIEEKQKNS